MTRSVGAIVLLSLTCLVACDDTSSPAPQASTTTPAASTPASAAPNWAQVTASDQRTAMPKLQELIRNVDAWHKGQKPNLTLTFASGQATDGLGNAFAISAEDWKGIQGVVRGPGRDSLTIRAGASVIYQDGLGDVPRFNYEAKMGDDYVFVLRTLGPHQ